MSVYIGIHVYIYICVFLCDWVRDVHRNILHDSAAVSNFSGWLRRRIVSFADFTASNSFTNWNSEFFADSSLESRCQRLNSIGNWAVYLILNTIENIFVRPLNFQPANFNKYKNC